MNTDNIKKAILFRWMYSIFVSKDADDKTFSDKRAVDILNKSNFDIPYNKDITPFLKEVTSEFREAMKKKEVIQLLEKYPMPELKLERKKELESDSDEELESDSDEELKLDSKKELESDSDEEEYKEFKKGDIVVYLKTDEISEILEVHKDDFPNIYYTIKTEDSKKEIQTEGKNLIDTEDYNNIDDLRDDIEVLIDTGYNKYRIFNHIIKDLKKIYTVTNSEGEDIVKKHKKKIKEIIKEKEKLEDPFKGDLEGKVYYLKTNYILARKSYVESRYRCTERYMEGYNKGYKYGRDKTIENLFANKDPVKYNDNIILKERYFNELQNKARKCNDSNLISRDSKEYLVLKEFFKNSMAHNHMGTETLSTEQKFHPSIMEKYYNTYVRH